MKEISLLQVKEQEEIIVVSIMGGQMVTKRLADLGLTPGTQIKILRKTFFGPLEIEARGSKLVIGRGLAAKISVRSL
jgi:Fe2+ transport system protein FeoA